LERPDFLGNGLFVVFSTCVLYHALLLPEGFWFFLLLLLVMTVGLVGLVLELCWLAWRAWFSSPKAR
jgi:cytochrome c biogenesis protein ResB